MEYSEIVKIVADILKEFDAERPKHKAFQPGVGPFGEPQLVKKVAQRLTARGIGAATKQTPDLDIQNEWAMEFEKIN